MGPNSSLLRGSTPPEERCNRIFRTSLYGIYRVMSESLFLSQTFRAAFTSLCSTSLGSARLAPNRSTGSNGGFAPRVNRHTRESHIQRSFRTLCGTERQLGGAAAGPARSSRRKSTLLAVPSLLDEKELHDEKEFLQQMRAGPLDRRFPLFLGLRCMLFHSQGLSWILR